MSRSQNLAVCKPNTSLSTTSFPTDPAVASGQDGGCTCPGDVAKAFGAGADFVMLGGMLAGHDQSGGEIIERGGSRFKLFYGMSSATAMEKHAGGVAEYR